MKKRILVSAVAVLIVACSDTRLTSDLAAKLIAEAVDDRDVTVAVGGVSQADNSTEAMVQVRLLATDLRLSFRRYDTGWKWETTDTPAGARIPAALAITQLKDAARLKRAEAWAAPLVEEYQQSAAVMQYIGGYLSRKPELELNEIMWKDYENTMLPILRGAKKGQLPDRLLDLLPRLDPPTDGWGRKIQWVLNAGERSALIVSHGPDGAVDTDDDLVCMLQGKKAFDSYYERTMWDYSRQWKLPEGLAAAMKEFLPPERVDATVVYVRLTK